MSGHSQMVNDSDADDFDDDDFGPRCMSCGGEGIVDSVCEESGRWGWDDNGPVAAVCEKIRRIFKSDER